MLRAMISCDAWITNRFKFCPANSLLPLVAECSFIADECVELVDMIEKLFYTTSSAQWIRCNLICSSTSALVNSLLGISSSHALWDTGYIWN